MQHFCSCWASAGAPSWSTRTFYFLRWCLMHLLDQALCGLGSCCFEMSFWNFVNCFHTSDFAPCWCCSHLPICECQAVLKLEKVCWNVVFQIVCCTLRGMFFLARCCRLFACFCTRSPAVCLCAPVCAIVLFFCAHAVCRRNVARSLLIYLVLYLTIY